MDRSFGGSKASILGYITLILLYSLIPEPIIWFASKLVIIIYFMNLASKWPDLMQYWYQIEKNVPAYNTKKRNRIFCNEIKFYTVTISVLIFGKEDRNFTY